MRFPFKNLNFLPVSCSEPWVSFSSESTYARNNQKMIYQCNVLIETKEFRNKININAVYMVL